MSNGFPHEDLDNLGVLNDVVRRRVYAYVGEQLSAVTRDDVAAGVDVSRNLAAYHLDKLAEAGLLDTEFARVNGRTGPGAGRPAKHYVRSNREVSVSLPPRTYDLLAEIFATAAENAPSDEFRRLLNATATARGKSLSGGGEPVSSVLATAGYEPVRRDDGTVELRNCPFHRVMHDHTELVCTMNCAFIAGALEGAGEDPTRAVLAPHAGRCCVVITPAPVDTLPRK